MVREPKQPSFLPGRLLVWFSCGAASAVAAKLMPAAEVIYCDTSRDEHEDNIRFMHDVEQWIGRKVTIIRSDKYATTAEVFEHTGYMSGIDGARCTTELKKLPRLAHSWPGDIHAFGFTADEKDRVASFEKNNPELYLTWPLVEEGLTKEDCLETLRQAGIVLPAMYRLGFKNNNCKGCVKATSPKYWNMTRRLFPDVFWGRAKQSRELGVRLVRYKGERIFLDELPPDSTEDIQEDLSCGPVCGIQGVRNELLT
jgi:hypothetical protein